MEGRFGIVIMLNLVMFLSVFICIFCNDKFSTSILNEMMAKLIEFFSFFLFFLLKGKEVFWLGYEGLLGNYQIATNIACILIYVMYVCTYVCVYIYLYIYIYIYR